MLLGAKTSVRLRGADIFNKKEPRTVLDKIKGVIRIDSAGAARKTPTPAQTPLEVYVKGARCYLMNADAVVNNKPGSAAVFVKSGDVKCAKHGRKNRVTVEPGMVYQKVNGVFGPEEFDLSSYETLVAAKEESKGKEAKENT